MPHLIELVLDLLCRHQHKRRHKVRLLVLEIRDELGMQRAQLPKHLHCDLHVFSLSFFLSIVCLLLFCQPLFLSGFLLLLPLACLLLKLFLLRLLSCNLGKEGLRARGRRSSTSRPFNSESCTVLRRLVSILEQQICILCFLL